MKVSERAFQRAVIRLAEANGWRVAHFRPGMNSRGAWTTAMSGSRARGFPDLVLLRERIVFAELKGEKGRPTPDQTEWIRDLLRANVEAHLWRPSDWSSIEAILGRTRRSAP